MTNIVINKPSINKSKINKKKKKMINTRQNNLKEVFD